MGPISGNFLPLQWSNSSQPNAINEAISLYHYIFASSGINLLRNSLQTCSWTSGVNFTNILQAAFCTKKLFQTYSFVFVFLGKNKSRKKLLGGRS